MNNPYYTRNNDRDFYDEYQEDTNCGSFALSIEEWYNPNDNFEKDGNDYATKVFEETKDIVYATDMLFKRCCQGIIEDFGDEIEVIDNIYNCKLKDNEELIAFRVGIDPYGFYANTDFHFRVFRDGRWQEKCGCGPVEDYIELEPDTEWELYNWSYDSDIFYFIHRVGVEEN